VNAWREPITRPGGDRREHEVDEQQRFELNAQSWRERDPRQRVPTSSAIDVLLLS